MGELMNIKENEPTKKMSLRYINRNFNNRPPEA